LFTKEFAQRNFNKGVRGRRFSHILLYFSLTLERHFSPPTLNLCFGKTCKSFHEKGLNIFPQRNLYGGGVVFPTIEIPATLKKMGSKPILEQVPLECNVIYLGVTLDVQEIGELINGTME
jgi:hypothetical protein